MHNVIKFLQKYKNYYPEYFEKIDYQNAIMDIRVT